MITVDQCVDFAIAAVSADVGVSTWMTANYPSYTLKHVKGLNRDNPPGEPEVIYVCYSPSDRPYDMGEGAEARHPEFDLFIGILDRTKTVSGVTTTWAGATNICTFAEVVRLALRDYFGAGVFNTCKVAFGGVAPLWEASLEITLWYEEGTGEVNIATLATGGAGATALQPPSVPVISSVTANSSSQITVVWAASSGTPTQYMLYQAPDVAGSPGTFSLIYTLPLTTLSKAVTGLTTATKYWFALRAHNGAGNSAQSVAGSATTL